MREHRHSPGLCRKRRLQTKGCGPCENSNEALTVSQRYMKSSSLFFFFFAEPNELSRSLALSGFCWSGGRGGTPPPPSLCCNTPNTQHIEQLIENELFSTWKCHVVSSKHINIFILGQFRVT